MKHFRYASFDSFSLMSGFSLIVYPWNEAFHYDVCDLHYAYLTCNIHCLFFLLVPWSLYQFISKGGKKAVNMRSVFMNGKVQDEKKVRNRKELSLSQGLNNSINIIYKYVYKSIVKKYKMK